MFTWLTCIASRYISTFSFTCRSGLFVCLGSSPFHHIHTFSFNISTFFRIYAALSKRPGLTSLCIAIILGQLLFSIGSGALCLYLLFKTSPSQDLSAFKCVAISSDLFTQNLCQRTSLTKGIAVASLTIIWLVEIGRSICEILASAAQTCSSDGGCRQLLPISASGRSYGYGNSF